MLHFLHNIPLYISHNNVDEQMKDLMERFAVLPFSGACIAQSSVAVSEHRPKRLKAEIKTKFCAMSALNEEEDDEEEEGVTSLSMKNSLRLMSLPRLFKIFSQLFEYKEEIDEVEMKMEIGSPTNVKHVTHIGYDGSTTTSPIMGWDNLIAQHFDQFELAMASQTNSLFVT